MAQVESTPTTVGMALCVQALGGAALRAENVESLATDIVRRVRHFIAVSCASPPSLPPPEHTTKWLSHLEGIARGRLQTLSEVRIVVSPAVPPLLSAWSRTLNMFRSRATGGPFKPKEKIHRAWMCADFERFSTFPPRFMRWSLSLTA